MAWYWITLIIIGYIIIGIFASVLVYYYRNNDIQQDYWDYIDFIIASLVWPIFVVYLPFHLIGKGAIKITNWLFPKLRTLN